MKQQLFICRGTNVWPHHCAEIWSDVGIVLESPCARISRLVGGGLRALIPFQVCRLPGLAALSPVRKPIKLWHEDEFIFLNQSFAYLPKKIKS